MQLAIETTGVDQRLGSHFGIADLSMRVPAGSVYGFLGPNGAGKTTTIRLLLGLARADRGRITVLGQEMPGRYVEVLARTGYVPERPHLYPSLTVREAMDLHRAFHRRWDEGWAGELQRELGLVDERRIGALSKGETGKLMMLLALAQRPDLLVLDEPTDGLDPVARRDALQALLGYMSSSGATVLISSHLVHELERICDWVGVMDRGRLAAEMPMQEFRSGIKRLRLADAPATLEAPPFVVLARERQGAAEQWLVRGWVPEMRDYMTGIGASVREVVDLDLEEGFVELLRSTRVAAH